MPVPNYQAVSAFLDNLDVAQTRFYGFDYSAGLRGTPSKRLSVLPGAIDHILAKARDSDAESKLFINLVVALVKAIKLASGSKQATEYAKEVAFFAAVRSSLGKLVIGGSYSDSGADFAIQQLINNALPSTEVIDLLEACGFDRPDISVLSDAFIRELQY